jgi:hypothetical protein
VSAPPADEAARLRRLLAMVMAPPSPSAWERPTEPLRRAAALAYLLLDRQPPHDAASFLTAGLDHLVRELARNSARQVVTDQRGVRGRVLWSATIAAQAERGDGAPTFVYREVRPQYDSPENQLLRFVVELLYAGIQALPAPLHAATCYMPGQGLAEGTPAGPRLAQIAGALRRARASAGLRAATLPARITPQHMLRAETARNEGYAIVSRIYRRYAALASPSGWRAALGEVGRRAIILPDEPGPQADMWVELAAIALREPAPAAR